MQDIVQLRRRLSIPVMGVMMAVLIVASATAQELQLKPATEAARKGLQGYVNDVLNEENVIRFGFKTLKEARQSRLGTPYEMAMVGLKDLKAYRSGTKLESMLIDTKTLWWPIMVDTVVRTKMEMIFQEQRWIAGEFGGTKSVESVVRAGEQLPRLLESMGVQAPYDLKLIEIPVLYAVFIYVKGSQGEFLVPAMIQPERLALSQGQIYSVDEVLPGLKEKADKISEDSIR